jgi:energy-coupling factor transporter transmembrane protein EcfT
MLTFFSSGAFAEASATQQVVDASKEKLAVELAKIEVSKAEAIAKAKEATIPTVPTSEKVMAASTTALTVTTQWAEAGKGLAVGIVSAAKEAGVAVNEFSTSPVGKITTGIIIWKMMGKDILAIITSVSILLLGVPFVWFVYSNVQIISYKYEDKIGWFGRTYRQKTEVVKREGFEDFLVTAGMIISMIVLISTSLNMLPFH